SLQAARFAFDTGDYEAALVACEQVLELDPDHRTAVDLLDQCRVAIQQREARQLLAEARERFALGDFTEAARAVADALALAPEDESLHALQDQIEQGQADAGRNQARAAALQNAMGRLHASVDKGELEQALDHIDVVLRIDATHAEALRLRALVY